MSDRLGKGLLVAASVLVSLVMAEIAARFLWLPPQKVSITRAADYGARMEAERQPVRVEVAVNAHLLPLVWTALG